MSGPANGSSDDEEGVWIRTCGVGQARSRTTGLDDNPHRHVADSRGNALELSPRVVFLPLSHRVRMLVPSRQNSRCRNHVDQDNLGS